MNKRIIFSIIFINLLLLIIYPIGHVLGATGATLDNPLEGVNDFGTLFGKIVTAIGNLIATIGGIMIIVAGILYLTSAGSPEKIATAKKAFIYAMVGIVLGLAASTIVDFVKNTISD